MRASVSISNGSITYELDSPTQSGTNHTIRELSGNVSGNAALGLGQPLGSSRPLNLSNLVEYRWGKVRVATTLPKRKALSLNTYCHRTMGDGLDRKLFPVVFRLRQVCAGNSVIDGSLSDAETGRRFCDVASSLSQHIIDIVPLFIFEFGKGAD